MHAGCRDAGCSDSCAVFLFLLKWELYAHSSRITCSALCAKSYNCINLLYSAHCLYRYNFILIPMMDETCRCNYINTLIKFVFGSLLNKCFCPFPPPASSETWLRWQILTSEYPLLQMKWTLPSGFGSLTVEHSSCVSWF